MTVNITPLHDRVLVRRLEEKATAKGGIIIPDTAREKPHEGEVIAVGAGKQRRSAVPPPALGKLKLDDDEAIGVNIVKGALEEPLRQAAQNAGHEGAVSCRRPSPDQLHQL